VGAEAKYEQYREAWGLLRKASEIGDVGSIETSAVAESAVIEPSSAVGRMATAANYFRRYMERSTLVPPRPREKS
jgi:hypothetical protein